MKKNVFVLIIFSMSVLIMTSCKNNESAGNSDAPSVVAEDGIGQSGVQDDVSNPNIVQVAVGSKDHTTLVTAVKAAGLVDVLSNAGPFTVFAPTNEAFAKLPKGTVEGLLKADKVADLKNILEYHTYVGNLKTDYMNDGQSYEEVNGQQVTITKKDGKVFVNGAEIVASITTSNGMIHVINDVLLPPAAK